MPRSTHPFRALLPWCSALVLACGGDPSGDTGDTGNAPSTSHSSDTSHSSGTTVPDGNTLASADDATASGTTAASTDTTAASTDTTVGPPPIDRGPCARVEQCLFDTDSAVTEFLSVYGETGTCWDRFPQEACWQDCRALLDAWHEGSCSEYPSCCHCEQDEDCADQGEGIVCSGSNQCVDGASSCQLVASLHQMCGGFDDHWLGLCEDPSPGCASEAAAFADCVWACLSDGSCTTFDDCTDFVDAVYLAYVCVAKGDEIDCDAYWKYFGGTCYGELLGLVSC